MKAKKIIRNILLGILGLVLAVLLILQIGVTVKYWDFYMDSQRGFLVPGLFSDFVPQGFDYLEDRDTWLMSGYTTDGSGCRVYVRDGAGKTHFATLRNTDGTPYTDHAGGIACNGGFAYLPGEDGVHVFSLTDILAGEETKMLGSIPMGHRLDFCSFVDGYLMIGNFYYGGHYETPEHHHVTTPAGEVNPAVITLFKADANGQFGLDPNAVAAFSIRERVQGMCLTGEGQIVLSTSWGLTDSKLYYYDVDLERKGTLETASGEVPLYYLDSANLTQTVTAPPMAEELVCKDGKVWILNESACDKYIYGRFIRGYWVYGYGEET